MVLERAKAWRLIGTLPLPGRGELATPVKGFVGGCGYFGCPRPGHLHNGVDFLAPTGTPIHAVDAGTITLVEGIGESGGYGNFVCVQHRPHLASCYAHMSSFAASVRLGARVKRGAGHRARRLDRLEHRAAPALRGPPRPRRLPELRDRSAPAAVWRRARRGAAEDGRLGPDLDDPRGERRRARPGGGRSAGARLPSSRRRQPTISPTSRRRPSIPAAPVAGTPLRKRATANATDGRRRAPRRAGARACAGRPR